MLRTLLLSLALLLAGAAGLSAATDGWQAFTSEAARRLAVRRQPLQIPAVPLQEQTGARLEWAGLRGQWLLVDFIYTRCPSVCLALGSDFAQLQQGLAAPLAEGRLRLLSISFDPEHDTPQQLARWLQRAGSHDAARGSAAGWLAARPVQPAGLQQLERAFGITVVPDAFGGYTHNAAIHLLDPRGRLVAIYPLGETAELVHAVTRAITGASGDAGPQAAAATAGAARLLASRGTVSPAATR